MNKINREIVFQKYNGHCAYCGCKLEFKKFQVDHLWPKIIAHHDRKFSHDQLGNLMPSCQKCNIHKHAMKLEVWRKELQRQVSMLRKNAQFDRILRFGQIVITEKPIIFHFETYEWQRKRYDQ